ncbi:MAG: transglycosylase SLT domain-containing protein [Desulfobacterales bacterium]|jgi:membrane-bound lytic murein transglycosylase F
MTPLPSTSSTVRASTPGALTPRFTVAFNTAAFLVLLGTFTACHRSAPLTPLAHILGRGELTFLVHQNPDGIYWSRSAGGEGQLDGGFEYELAHLLARHLGVKLILQPVAGGQEMLAALMAGEGDIIAGADFNSAMGRDHVLFSRPFLTPLTQTILAPNTPERFPTPEERSQGARYSVHRREIYRGYLERLDPPLAKERVVGRPELDIEGLFRAVAAGELSAALVDAPLAGRLTWDYPQVRQGPKRSPRRVLAWAVPAHGRQLKARLDAFVTQLERDGRLARLVQRYFPGKAQDPELGVAAFHQRIPARLPDYLDTIRLAAARHGFDWELIAALTYQESLWKPGAVSSAGARGLMQLLPDTAKSLGVDDIHDPRENIRAGVRYLSLYYSFYDRAPPEERLKIALAAYNVGIGHILDARNLARRRRLDPNRWESLVETLPLLSLPEYYRHSQYGYCRGSEPVQYVESIMIYYGILKRRVLSIKQARGNPATVSWLGPERRPGSGR